MHYYMRALSRIRITYTFNLTCRASSKKSSSAQLKTFPGLNILCDGCIKGFYSDWYYSMWWSYRQADQNTNKVWWAHKIICGTTADDDVYIATIIMNFAALSKSASYHIRTVAKAVTRVLQYVMSLWRSYIWMHHTCSRGV